MLVAALRDMEWRRRRFAVAVVGTGLVFGMTLLMSGISHGFGAEADRTVAEVGVEHWIVKAGAAGPFLGAVPMPAATMGALRGQLPADRAAGFVFTRKTVLIDGEQNDLNVFGAEPGGPGMPAADEGRSPRAAGEAELSTALPGYHLGSVLRFAGREFTVVGRLHGSTAVAGAPNVFLTLPDAQRVAYAGLPLMAAVAVRGPLPASLPAGLEALGPAQARADLLRPMQQAGQAITLMSVLLWAVAVLVIGSVIYLSALERQRDFAVFKATGVSNGSILAGMALQAVLMSIAAALIGTVVAVAMGPHFPMIVSIPFAFYLLMPAGAIGAGLVATLSGLRRAVSVDPALAFGGP